MLMRRLKSEGFIPPSLYRRPLAASQQRLFGTNGVRFVPGVSHDLDFVISLAESIGTYFGSGEILLGQDGRLSSTALANAAVSGLLSSGRDVA